LDRAGIERRVTFYDLRHTAATLHREAGADPLVIRLALGHANRNLTDDLYTHLSLAYQATELSRLCICGNCAGEVLDAKIGGSDR
jgi:integrase